jgi:hypothetical protein
MSDITIEDENETLSTKEEEVSFEENEKFYKAKSFLENVENELSDEVKSQVKSGFDDFTNLLSSIDLDPRLASLWKLIYANAMTDRKNAFALFLDLYVITFSDTEKHFQHGQTLTKYMEAMSRANQQLLKLADLVDKARDKKEERDNADLAAEFFSPQSKSGYEPKRKK